MEQVPLVRRLELIALRPDITRSEVERLCDEARRADCQSIGVNLSRLEIAASRLEDSRVRLSALIGFPFGATDPEVKRLEIETAVDLGAHELECVINLGWLKDGEDRAILRELRDLREAAEERPVKLVIEHGLLGDEETRRAGLLAQEAELQFLVNATGCAPRAVTVEEVRNLRSLIGPDLGLKVVGGISDPFLAEHLIGAGANRLGVFSLAPFVPGHDARS